ncbi:restriction endonuclease subunit R [Nonlabens spongiae]|uniref:Restriction endonuclease subunit R n=1 Tax=Nonlabens spongiae TaxID=331648 RepID=A0A1W6MJU3_9FLAO|nr:type I restriction enzyme HsdR N-terminal domain-containing protein [Nonlabens spongiae]ARN77739.1 restriction endonuclease subunit R [Nonlabens spongiae]
MIPLRLPPATFRIKNTEKGQSIFDPIRKKFVHLTPEEWVRQHVVFMLLSRKRTPQNLMNIEKELNVAGTKKRYDILVYNKDGSIFLAVECKAPKVKIDQNVFDQIARYNLALDADYLMVTNGLSHYYCIMDYEHKSYNFIEELPDYQL